MKKNILFSILTLHTIVCFAQEEQRNAEISELAKQNAKAYCECPHLDILISFTKDFENKKITFKEYEQGGKMAVAQIADCTRSFVKEIKALSREEAEFFSKESKKYRLEFCKITVENHK